MEKCIYYKNSSCDLTYTTVEHIIPKCIGGIRCLNIGYVSDQANELFSPLELHFARNNPLIAIPRMFEQNTGRKKHKNREQIAVSIDETGHPLLAYLKEGKPICISQAIVYMQETNSNEDDKCISRIRFVQSKTDNNCGLKELINGLQTFDKYTTLMSEQIKANQYIIGLKRISVMLLLILTVS